jgi:hypothetical protein
MINTISKIEDYLLNVDVDLFIKSMQSAIDKCPQGMYDESAKWASYYKNKYYRFNQPKNDCIQWRVSLFTLKDSNTLNSAGYFQFLSDQSKEVYHYSKIYQHLLAIESLTSMSK